MATVHDIVLIYFEGKPLSFARVEEILPDHKPNWYHVRLLLLQVPLQVVTWILRDIYIDGAEFTMDGKKMRLETVVCPPEAPDRDTPDSGSGRENPPGEKNGRARVISLSDRKQR